MLLFIGAGKMATAIALGYMRRGGGADSSAERVLAYDISEKARRAFTEATGVPCVADAAEAVGQADRILLAVKPQHLVEALAALPPFPSNALVISICAGVPLAKLQKLTGTGRLIRVMPNTPLMVGKGASCYAPGPKATKEDLAFVGSLLGSSGLARQVDESLLDAVTALSGSGPAYVFEMAKAMVLAGQAVGLDEALSTELTLQTIAGAAEMLSRREGTPDELRDAVTSPHGTTFEGLEVMRKQDFRDMMRRVVIAARDRSIELGK